MYFSVLDAKGLYTYANPLGAQSVPGAMSVANNVNCDQIGNTTTRRGLDFYSTYQFDISGGLITKMFGYSNTLYLSYGAGKFSRDTGSGAWSDYPGLTMLPPAGGFLHQMQAGGNSYFTTSNGIYKLSGVNANPPIPAGAPVGLDTQITVSALISSGFLNAQSQCAYSIVWGYTDASNLLIIGAPSNPAFATNTQSAGPTNNANTTVVFSIPPFVVANSTLPWFYQIYRTPNTGSITVPPGNNYQLVTQLNPTVPQYAARVVTFVDTVLDSLLGANLYTDSGQPDVGNPYNQPPLAQDIGYFSNMAFYANYSTLQDVFFTLDAVGPTLGFQVNDRFNITDSGSATVYSYKGVLSTAGTSTSGAAPATTATSLSFKVNINGDGAQTILVDDGGTHTGAHIAAVIQSAIQALTANSAFNQSALTNATCTFTAGLYVVTSGTIANTGFPSSVVITGAGASTLKLGLANGGVELAGVNGNNPTLRTFYVDATGTPAQNIQNTAQNLVSVINQDPNNVFYIAQYISGYSNLPGQMQLFAQNLSQVFFSLISTRTTCWSPALPSAGVTYASANVTVQHMLAISEPGKPESVPPAFTEPVGSPNFPISRVIPVRTALVVVKPKEGVFLVTGTSPQALTVTSLDTTAFILGSETMQALNNSGYFFTTQGVMLVNESGCEIMSRNVQGDILELASSNFPNFSTLAFGLGYQSDNAYVLFLQAAPGDLYSTLQYRYNWITQAWTTWDIPSTAAVINTANDMMYLATPDGYILEERKTFTNSDYADETTQITINSIVIAPPSFVLADSSNVTIGDQISQTSGPTTSTCVVKSNDTTTNTIVVDTIYGFTTGTADDAHSINSTVTFMPTSCGYPAFIKKFTTWNFEFSNIFFEQCTVSFTTDFFPFPESVTLTPSIGGTWGTFPWGANPWGVTPQLLQPISTYSTKNTSMGHWTNVTINIQEAFSGFGLSGYTIFFNFQGERSR